MFIQSFVPGLNIFKITDINIFKLISTYCYLRELCSVSILQLKSGSKHESIIRLENGRQE